MQAAVASYLKAHLPTSTQIADIASARVEADLLDPETTVSRHLSDTFVRVASPTAVIVGDSIMMHAQQVTGTVTTNRDRGFWNWANARLGRRFTLLHNAGVGGERTDQILARIDADVIAYSPGWCFELSGTNDMIQGVTVATAKANRLAIWNKILAAGIKLVVGTIPPYSAVGATAGQQAFIAEFNSWVRAQASVLPILVVDYYSVVVSPTGTGWAYGTTDNDGIHPDRAGCAAMGRLLADAIAPLTAPNDTLISSNSDANLLVNGMMDGNTSGGATGYAITYRGGGSVAPTASKVARTDGRPGEWQQLVVAPGNELSGAFIYKKTGAATPGQVVYADCEIEMDADISQFKLLLLRVSPISTGLTKLTPQAVDFDPYSNSVIVPVSNRLTRATLRTPLLTLPALTQSCLWELEFRGEGTIRVTRASIRVVT